MGENTKMNKFLRTFLSIVLDSKNFTIHTIIGDEKTELVEIICDTYKDDQSFNIYVLKDKKGIIIGTYSQIADSMIYDDFALKESKNGFFRYNRVTTFGRYIICSAEYEEEDNVVYNFFLFDLYNVYKPRYYEISIDENNEFVFSKIITFKKIIVDWNWFDFWCKTPVLNNEEPPKLKLLSYNNNNAIEQNTLVLNFEKIDKKRKKINEFYNQSRTL
jgi:hypothetical protein